MKRLPCLQPKSKAQVPQVLATNASGLSTTLLTKSVDKPAAEGAGTSGPLGSSSTLSLLGCITDEPPPEVAAAGHDRCIVPIKRENIDAWLSPDASDLTTLHAILDDRDRPFYERRLAA
ncbi:hypothetical protein FVF58_26920 [Paraburkholderia panacisoli]|uniref:SOS response associated peptidase (SRAP) n=1 Tax=Paraburkholderia panacisoli TaxID=2603818 RepID=A0A5B0GTG3_9BURK|nr:hypothetical protein FVF58_26920 [Paraburkholderia panacisoli]